MGEALDGRVRGEMLRGKSSQLTLHNCRPEPALEAGFLIARGGRPAPRNREPPSFGRGEVSTVGSSGELGFGCTSSNQLPISKQQTIDTDIEGMDIDPGSPNPGTISTLNPGTFGAITGVSQPVSVVIRRTELGLGCTILCGTGIMVGIGVN